jgi:hypothetical protein
MSEQLKSMRKKACVNPRFWGKVNENGQLLRMRKGSVKKEKVPNLFPKEHRDRFYLATGSIVRLHSAGCSTSFQPVLPPDFRPPFPSSISAIGDFTLTMVVE